MTRKRGEALEQQLSGAANVDENWLNKEANRQYPDSEMEQRAFANGVRTFAAVAKGGQGKSAIRI
jgi:hypothetical protein